MAFGTLAGRDFVVVQLADTVNLLANTINYIGPYTADALGGGFFIVYGLNPPIAITTGTTIVTSEDMPYGTFSNPRPSLTITHSARPVRALKVVGDSARGEYPLSFSVKLYDVNNTLLHTENVAGNTSVNWSKDIEPILGVTKQVLQINTWSHAERCVKIIEFYTSVREVYEAENIVSLRLLEEREASQGSLPVGNISANEITISLNNEDKKYDIDNDQSPFKNLLKPNRKYKFRWVQKVS